VTTAVWNKLFIFSLFCWVGACVLAIVGNWGSMLDGEWGWDGYLLWSVGTACWLVCMVVRFSGRRRSDSDDS
jgi:hypothetical protein